MENKGVKNSGILRLIGGEHGWVRHVLMEGLEVAVSNGVRKVNSDQQNHKHTCKIHQKDMCLKG